MYCPSRKALDITPFKDVGEIPCQSWDKNATFFSTDIPRACPRWL